MKIEIVIHGKNIEVKFFYFHSVQHYFNIFQLGHFDSIINI